MAQPTSSKDQDRQPMDISSTNVGDPFSRFPDATVKSAEDLVIWTNTHKADVKAKEKIDEFEESMNDLYELESLKAEADFAYVAYLIKRRKMEFHLQMSELRKIFHNGNQPLQEQPKTSPDPSFCPPTKSETNPENFKTVIFAQMKLEQPKEVASVILLGDYQKPILVQSYKQTQFALSPSEGIFRYSEIAQNGYLEHLPDLETKTSSKTLSWSDVNLIVDPPFWRLHRDGNDGDRFFVAPKTEHHSHEETEDAEQERWVQDESAGDIFLALGWLVEKIEGGTDRDTRYVCALNLSSDPLSMWLIYDYRQPNDDSYLCTADIPTVEKQNFYLDSDDESQGTSSGPVAGQETSKGYIDHHAPWDIARLYKDALNDWPEDSAAAARVEAPTALKIYDPAQTSLRAKRVDPPASLLTRHFQDSLLGKE